MSRRSNRNANALAGLAAEALDADNFAPKRNSPKMNHNYYGHSNRKNGKGSLHIDTLHKASPLISLVADDATNGTLGSADAANDGDMDEEEEEADDEDPAVLAPPDHANHTLDGQAGLTLRGDDFGAASPTAAAKHYNRGSTDLETIVPSAEPLYQTTTGIEQAAEDDDEGYNAVDLISESDGEDPNIEQLEEDNIINDLKDDGVDNGLGDFNIFSDGSLFPGDMPYFDEQMRRMEYSNLAADMQMYKSTDTLDSFPSAPSPPPPTPTTDTRRVRFDVSALKSPNSITFDQDFLFGSSFFNEDDDSSVGSMSGYESGCCEQALTCRADLPCL